MPATPATAATRCCTAATARQRKRPNNVASSCQAAEATFIQFRARRDKYPRLAAATVDWDGSGVQRHRAPKRNWLRHPTSTTGPLCGCIVSCPNAAIMISQKEKAAKPTGQQRSHPKGCPGRETRCLGRQLLYTGAAGPPSRKHKWAGKATQQEERRIVPRPNAASPVAPLVMSVSRLLPQPDRGSNALTCSNLRHSREPPPTPITEQGPQKIMPRAHEQCVAEEPPPPRPRSRCGHSTHDAASNR